MIPIKDQNLKLALLDAMHPNDPEWPDKVDEAELTEAALAKIETITFDAGNRIYAFVAPDWDGEDDHFTIRDLSGIENCVNLKVFDNVALLEVKSLDPLGRLPNLERFNYFAGPDLGDLAPIARAPKLRYVQLHGHYTNSPANQQVLQSLKARGVQVDTIEERQQHQQGESLERNLRIASDAAATAFREKKYKEVVRHLERFEADLKDSDRTKLQYARKKLKE